MMMLVLAINEDTTVNAAAPQGFKFACVNGVCPSGNYQNLCPQCSELDYPDTSSSSMQCYCFNSGKLLQPIQTLGHLELCTAVDVASSGSLTCTTSPPTSTIALQNSAKSIFKKKPTAPPTVFNPVLVSFVFNCVSGSCPAGPYQQFCPLCSVNGNSLSCLCFDAHGQMLLPETTMWNFSSCTSITTTETGGYLACPSAVGGTVVVSSSL